MKFDVLYVDPPWQFNMVKTGGSFTSGAAQKYPPMPLAEIAQLPVQAISRPSSVTFLWVPTRLKFSHGAHVMNAWGLDYITTIYWNKCRIGLGYWFRNQVEELLVCQRRGGNMAPFRCQLPNILSLPPGEHSAKPEEFRRLIENATGRISRRQCIELFGRKATPGWTVLGNQVTGRDIRMDIKSVSSWPQEYEDNGETTCQQHLMSAKASDV